LQNRIDFGEKSVLSIEVGSVVVLTSCVTTASGMLSVFAHTTMTGLYVTPQLSVLLETGRLRNKRGRLDRNTTSKGSAGERYHGVMMEMQRDEEKPTPRKNCRQNHFRNTQEG